MSEKWLTEVNRRNLEWIISSEWLEDGKQVTGECDSENWENECREEARRKTDATLFKRWNKTSSTRCTCNIENEPNYDTFHWRRLWASGKIMLLPTFFFAQSHTMWSQIKYTVITLSHIGPPVINDAFIAPMISVSLPFDFPASYQMPRQHWEMRKIFIFTAITISHRQ